MKFVKKLLNILLILVGVVLIVFCADLVLNKTVKTSYEDLSDTDRRVLEQVCDILNLYDEKYGNEYIWCDDYNPINSSFVVTGTYGDLKGTSYAVNVDLSESFFTQKIEMPSEYSDIKVYRFSAFAPQTISLYAPANDGLMLDIGGSTAYSLKYSSGALSHYGSGSFEQEFVDGTFRTLVQTGDTPTPENNSGSFELTTENIALTGLQYRIIDEMRNCGNNEELKELIAEYVTVREEQTEEYPGTALNQAKIELADGCPEYVLYMTSAELDHNYTYFNKVKPNEIDFYSAFYYVCTGQYQKSAQEYFDYTGNVYVGAALCEILDGNNLADDWRERLDNSSNSAFVSQYSILKEYYLRECGEYRTKTVDEIKDAYNYEEILRMSELLAGELGGADEEQ